MGGCPVNGEGREGIWENFFGKKFSRTALSWQLKDDLDGYVAMHSFIHNLTLSKNFDWVIRRAGSFVVLGHSSCWVIRRDR